MEIINGNLTYQNLEKILCLTNMVFPKTYYKSIFSFYMHPCVNLLCCD